VFGRAIVQAVNIDFELATIGLKEIGEWDIREGFEEVIQVAPVGFERLPCPSRNLACEMRKLRVISCAATRGHQDQSISFIALPLFYPTVMT
jgi:hypothetical protein